MAGKKYLKNNSRDPKTENSLKGNKVCTVKKTKNKKHCLTKISSRYCKNSNRLKKQALQRTTYPKIMKKFEKLICFLKF